MANAYIFADSKTYPTTLRKIKNTDLAQTQLIRIDDGIYNDPSETNIKIVCPVLDVMPCTDCEMWGEGTAIISVTGIKVIDNNINSDQKIRCELNARDLSNQNGVYNVATPVTNPSS